MRRKPVPARLGVSRRILSIVQESLQQGHSVEIDGLGSFLRADGGGYEFVPESRPLVFVAYAVEDLTVVRRFCDALAAAGCHPWLDKDKLLPGQNWPRAIERAIEISDAFVACFSPQSITKHGQFQSELRYALDCARLLPLDDVFVVPVRLEPCEVPARISRELQYVDLFPVWDRGIRRVVRSVRRATSRKVAPPRLLR
ncbi:MAG TPA: TIR domain-containing protein [Bryobacteraceae bacterium]|nr:TIR domain-containing protein [Bryobacteraceae bacterium]